MADWKTKVGDTEQPMVFDLSDAAGLVDLGAPGTAVRFQMKPKGQEPTILDAEADIDPDQTTNRGRVRYTFTDDDWTKPELQAGGDFWGEFKVTFSDGGRATFPNGERYIEIEVGAGVDDVP